MLFGYLSSVDRTHVGRKRSNNEDALLRVPEYGVFCVADGMGGTDAGEVASGRIVESLGEAMASPRAKRTLYDFAAKQRLIDETVNGASLWINRRAAERGRGGSGSTVVMLLFDAVEPTRAVTVHAGDSRVYRFRKGKLEQVTRDHSLAEEAGYKDESKMPKQFRGVVTRGVGIKEGVRLETTPVDVAEGDLFLLCSDGLSRMVPDKDLRAILKQNDSTDLEALSDLLIDTANNNGGVDNVSVILVKAGKLEPAAVPDDYLALVEGEGGPEAGNRSTGEEECRTTGDTATGEPTTERHTQEMVAPQGARRGIAGLSGKAKLSVIVAAVVLVAVTLSLLCRPRKDDASEWIASLNLERGRSESAVAYAGRLNGHLDACRERQAGGENTALADIEQQLADTLKAIPPTVSDRFTSAGSNDDLATARAALEDWRELKTCLGLVSLSEGDHARRLAEMVMSVDLEEFSRRVEVALHNLTPNEEAVVRLEGFLREATKGNDGIEPAWSAQGRAIARDAAMVWVRLFNGAFDGQLAELGEKLRPLLVTWENLRNHQVFVDALGTAYVDQNVAISQGLIKRANLLRNDVRAAVLHDDADAGRAALGRLQALADLAEGTSFHQEISEIARSAARIVDQDVNRRAELNKAVDGFVTRAAQISQCSTDAFAPLAAEFKEIENREGLDASGRKRMLEAIELALTRTAPKSVTSCLGAYESLKLQDGDLYLDALRKLPGTLPRGVPAAALKAPLAEAEAARAEAARIIGNMERELDEMGATILESTPTSWAAFADRLLALRPHRESSTLAADRWTETHTRFAHRIMTYAREDTSPTEKEKRVAACQRLLNSDSAVSLFDEDARKRLETAISQIGTQKKLLVALETLATEAGTAAKLDDLSPLLDKLRENHAQVEPTGNAEATAGLRKAVDAWTASLMKAVRSAPDAERATAAATAKRLLESDSGTALLGSNTVAVLVVELERVHGKALFVGAYRTGRWHEVRGVIEANPSASESHRTGAAAWLARWDEAHGIILSTKRKKHYADAMRALKDVADDLDVKLPSAPAVRYDAANTEWASAYCHAVTRRQRAIHEELDARAKDLAERLAVFGDTPSVTLRDLWLFVNEPKIESAMKLGARAKQARTRLADKQQWLASMASGPLDPRQILLYGETIEEGRLDCDNVWDEAIDKAVRIARAADTRREGATGAKARKLDQIAKLSEELKSGNGGKDGIDLAVLQALLAEVHAYGP